MLPSAEGAPSRYMDLTPYPGLPAPIVISSWGFQLKVSVLPLITVLVPRSWTVGETFVASVLTTPLALVFGHEMVNALSTISGKPPGDEVVENSIGTLN